MTNNLTTVQLISIALIVLPIAVVWLNNRLISARAPSTQMLMFGTLVLALFAAESSSKLLLIGSAVLFIIYAVTLCNYHLTVLTTGGRHSESHTRNCRRP